MAEQGMPWTELKKEFIKYGDIEWVDFNAGDSEAKIRFKAENIAEDIVKGVEDKNATLTINGRELKVRLLTTEEAKSYWDGVRTAKNKGEEKIKAQSANGTRKPETKVRHFLKLCPILMIKQIMKVQISKVWEPTLEGECKLFLDDVKDALYKVPTTESIISMAELNAHVAADTKSGTGLIRKNCHSDFNDKGMKLLWFCANNELSVLNTFKHQSVHQHTWYK
ncbi:unnamed protein product [Soboliphyme baturini]|uniref:RRM_3 domain-containing protein n=1 Tax=Soboliphyme baturini TaxID=241478 RepID=A0A183IQL9_9BILA|nr:unnamed protein product [Soboliphyme baturini]